MFTFDNWQHAITYVNHALIFSAFLLFFVRKRDGKKDDELLELDDGKGKEKEDPAPPPPPPGAGQGIAA